MRPEQFINEEKVFINEAAIVIILESIDKVGGNSNSYLSFVTDPKTGWRCSAKHSFTAGVQPDWNISWAELDGGESPAVVKCRSGSGRAFQTKH